MTKPPPTDEEVDLYYELRKTRYLPCLHAQLDAINETGKKERACLRRWCAEKDAVVAAKLKIELNDLIAQHRAARNGLTAAIRELVHRRPISVAGC